MLGKNATGRQRIFSWNIWMLMQPVGHIGNPAVTHARMILPHTRKYGKILRSKISSPMQSGFILHVSRYLLQTSPRPLKQGVSMGSSRYEVLRYQLRPEPVFPIQRRGLPGLVLTGKGISWCAERDQRQHDRQWLLHTADSCQLESDSLSHRSRIRCFPQKACTRNGVG